MTQFFPNSSTHSLFWHCHLPLHLRQSSLFMHLEQKARQRHQLYYERTGSGTERQGEVALLKLKDWVLSTTCACHDSHNALKWALQTFALESPDTTSHLHACIESLRNGFSITHAHLATFIGENLQFEDCFLQQPQLYALWTCLGVPSATAEELCELHLRWEQGRLTLWAIIVVRTQIYSIVSPHVSFQCGGSVPSQTPGGAQWQTAARLPLCAGAWNQNSKF